LPDSSKVVAQTKRDTLVLHVDGSTWDNSNPLKINSYENYKRNHSPPRVVILIIIVTLK